MSIDSVQSFRDLAPEQQAAAGGKGGMLAKLFQAGYPVPDGFVVLPGAFQNGGLGPLAWRQVQAHLQTLRQHEPHVTFAVRSSAVLFTADPVTGSYTGMVGNYVHGLGEQLVSGEANAETFHLSRPKGQYEGPAALQPYAAELYRIAARLEQEPGRPQDLEWAIAGSKLYLLQARPITTLSPGNLDKYAINETLVEDTLRPRRRPGACARDARRG